MDEFIWPVAFLVASILAISICCHFSNSKRWQKIVGSVCLFPFVYVITGSFMAPEEFANGLELISIPFLWVGIWLFFSPKRKLVWFLCILCFIIEALIQSLYCHPKFLEWEDQRYQKYRLEKQKRLNGEYDFENLTPEEKRILRKQIEEYQEYKRREDGFFF